MENTSTKTTMTTAAAIVAEDKWALVYVGHTAHHIQWHSIVVYRCRCVHLANKKGRTLVFMIWRLSRRLQKHETILGNYFWICAKWDRFCSGTRYTRYTAHLQCNFINDNTGRDAQYMNISPVHAAYSASHHGRRPCALIQGAVLVVRLKWFTEFNLGSAQEQSSV